MRTKTYIIFYILILCFLNGWAQPDDNFRDKLYFDLEGMTGSTWAHHQSINYLLEYPPAGLNLKAGLRSTGKRLWEADLNYPRYGLGYQYARLGGSVLGNAHSIYLFIGSDFWKTDKMRWYYDMGAGIGFIDNPYDEQKNPLNIVNGSVTNAFLRLSTGLNYTITPRHALGLNGGLFHLSNGNSSLPNWGVNTLYMSLNWQVKLTDTIAYVPDCEAEGIFQSYRITLYGAAGYKEEKPVDRQKFLVTDLHTNFWRQYRPAHSWGGGLSLFYDGASRKMLWRGDHEETIALDEFEIENHHYWALGAQVGYMLNMHPVYFSLEFGVYLWSQVDRDIFNRWLLEIQIAQRLRIYGGLKARFGRADFVEYGLGYDIFAKNK